MKLRSYSTKKAFTMIELVFVIIILGIVSSIGSEIIANIYKNFLLQRATYRASLKTELAAQQIANLLSYRIQLPKTSTTIARDPAALADTIFVTDPTNATDITHTTLEWIGADNDAFSAAILPPWNGFCDTNMTTSTQTSIKTPGSNLGLADTIFSNLSNGQVSLNGPQYPAIFFRSKNYVYDENTTNYPPNIAYEILNNPDTNNGCMGVISADRSCISTVKLNAGDNERLDFQFNGSVGKKVIAEHYKLAWTAYAIMQVPKAGTNNKLFDLKLCYNYQPWENERLANNFGCPGELSTIISNVSVFKFAESGSTFRFKICSQENIAGDYNISICKEKAIIL